MHQKGRETAAESPARAVQRPGEGGDASLFHMTLRRGSIECGHDNENRTTRNVFPPPTWLFGRVSWMRKRETNEKLGKLPCFDFDRTLAHFIVKENFWPSSAAHVFETFACENDVTLSGSISQLSTAMPYFAKFVWWPCRVEIPCLNLKIFVSAHASVLVRSPTSK